MSSRRIVFSTFGSFGDLHPYMALALELQARGHECVLATSPLYQEKVESAGLSFTPVRPDLPDPRHDPDEAVPLIRTLMDAEAGTERLFKDLIIPSLRDSYADLLSACEGTDLLVTHALPLSGPLVAQKLQLRWASAVLAPLSFFSAHDLCVPPDASTQKLFKGARKLPPRLLSPLIETGKKRVLSWTREVSLLRRDIGLPPGVHPIFEGQHSPSCVLALFSPRLAPPQPDWPPQAHVTGYAFYDKKDEAALDPRLSAFLSLRKPPIVFTLGSSAVFDAGTFFRESARAAQMLNRRAVFLIGREDADLPPLPDTILALDYAPFSLLFPSACVIVHQGGAGTTGQVLRSGVPSLVMPFAHDQPDHAARLERLGVARQIKRNAYTAENAARELRTLLENPAYAAKARELGVQVRAEEGTRKACELLEGMM